MDFNIRAICFAESVDALERTDPTSLLGEKIEFRSGISITVTLPHQIHEFAPLGDPALYLPGLFKWSRIYRYFDSDGEHLDVLSTAENAHGNLAFRVIEMLQQ